MLIKICFKNDLEVFHLCFEFYYVLNFNDFFLKVEAYVFGAEDAFLDALEILHVIHFEDDGLALEDHAHELSCEGLGF